jgi:tetratricopeptide (TPR) repeat protein
VEGKTLKELLAKGKPLPLRQTMDIVQQVASALEYAHSQGVIHRDIKPSNIVIEKGTGRVFITDFGLAKVPGEPGLTETGEVIGTPEYIAPDKELDHRSDIYSLGVVLFEMCTGRVPFKGEDARATLLAHYQEPVPPPRKFNRGLPEAVEDVIRRALTKHPLDRYQRAGELAKALEISLPKRKPKKREIIEKEMRREAATTLAEAIYPRKGASALLFPLRALLNFFYGRRFYLLAAIGIATLAFMTYLAIPPIIQGWLDYHYKACLAFQEAGEWDRAAGKCEFVIRFDPDYKDARERLRQIREQQKAYHYRRGIDAMDVGEWELAVKELSIVFDLDTTYREVKAKLKEAKRELAIVMAFTPTPEPTSTPIPTPTSEPTPTPTFMERVEALPMVESVAVPADGTEVSSTTELQTGQRYTIIARGKFQCASGKTCDASGKPYEGVGLGIENALIKPDFSDSERHIYVYAWTGSGAKIKFKILDTSYSNNAGGLVVEIREGWP